MISVRHEGHRIVGSIPAGKTGCVAGETIQWLARARGTVTTALPTHDHAGMRYMGLEML